MQALLRKVIANGVDKDDQLQFEIEEVDSDILELRRGQTLLMKVMGRQSKMEPDKKTGELKSVNPTMEGATSTISISICVLEDRQSAVVTVSMEDKEFVGEVMRGGLRGQLVDLIFE